MLLTERQWLKGSSRIVLDTVEEMLRAGQAVSVRRVAARVPYAEITVLRALRSLRGLGLVGMEQERPGCRARYCICIREEEN